MISHPNDYSKHEMENAANAIAALPRSDEVLARGLAKLGISAATIELGKSFGRSVVSKGWILRSHGGDSGGITYEVLLIDGTKVSGEGSMPESRPNTVRLARHVKIPDDRVSSMNLEWILRKAEFGP